MSVFDKKEKEKEVAIFFLNRYNNKFGKNLVGIPDNDDEESDYILKGSDEEIEIQIISCDHDLIPLQVKSQRLDIGKDPLCIERDWGKNIIQAINKKSNHYGSEEMKDRFLLIHSENISINSEYIIDKSKDIINKSGYKSIFFVKLPDNENKETYPINYGNIVQLK